MAIGFIWHLFLHLSVPVAVAWLFFRPYFKRAALIMFAAILIDLDHLLADPIVDPDRCSVGFHILHSYYIIPFYLLLCFFPKTRLIGLGLVIHIVLDWLECL
ncbi:hypothetical protein JAO76_17925 [Pontibacter sp. BT310]|uniref:Uncharacterized protein n=1 Tax=Pontibacter populi TaxID=890055 RepID=A0ABS6XG31_9BACT|nr:MULTISPECIES: DUF6122 family protein [Pontibacter]MBJ6120089.1 hypothetical protein [Pontibacter sp. BT310]MBR0572520.1 hypothetical protein [Microvirga sp. STS03]MBW3366942.1 hypothetical protein [Pontibacter populi]